MDWRGKQRWRRVGVLTDGGEMLYQLESRCLLSGNVSVSVRDGTLMLVGDGADNAILVDRAGTDQRSFQITSLNGDLVDGSNRPTVLQGVDRGISVDLGGGNDELVMSGLRIFGGVAIQGGAGGDSVLVRSTRISGDLTLAGGPDEDRLTLRNTVVQRNLDFNDRSSRDHLNLSVVHIRQSLNVRHASGPLDMYARELSVDGTAAIVSGSSIDSISLFDSTFKSAIRIDPGPNANNLLIRGTVFQVEPEISANSQDHVNRQITLSWDFSNGSQGWRDGFADYPAGQVVGTDAAGHPVTAEQAYRLHGSIALLPPELNDPATGFELSGDNLSDSLLMFLTREVGSQEGLLPNQRYSLSFNVKFATQLVAGQTSRYLDVGGFEAKPTYVEQDDSLGQPNRLLAGGLPIGLTAGRNASVAGLVHHGGGEPGGFVTTSRSHQHPYDLKTDSVGRLWLFVGFDSALEVPLDVFVQRVRVTLTPRD